MATLKAGQNDLARTVQFAEGYHPMKEALMSEHQPTDPIYCAVGLEFLQPWEHLPGVRKIKELALGNAVSAIPVFHVGDDDNRRFWKEQFPSLADDIDAVPRFPERPKYGMAAFFNLPLEFWLEELRLVRELGLLSLNYPMDPLTLTPDDLARVQEVAGDTLVTYCFMGETNVGGLPYERLRQWCTELPALLPGAVDETPPVELPALVQDVDLRQLHDAFLTRYRRLAANGRMLGVRYLVGIEADQQVRLDMEAGADCPCLELTPSEPIAGPAATRGAAKAYRAPLWGVYTALAYYQAPTNKWTPERLQIAYQAFYAAGAGLFCEMNMAIIMSAMCSGFFTVKGSPPQRLGEEERREFDDPLCARAREVMAEFYRFTQFHDRPSGGPRVKLGVVMGHLDFFSGPQQQFLLCADPAFSVGPAEAMWRHFPRLFESEEWYTPPRKYYWQADPAKFLWYGTPPCGQVDIVPIEAPGEVLQSYGCLVFLGWNTMTPEQYAKLTEYVRNGGRLLMCVPHLGAQLRRDTPLQVINNGDLTELFGVRVLGPGSVAEDVQIYEQSACESYVLPVNTLYLEEAPLVKVELHGARVLAHPRELDDPVLVEHQLGKGFTWLVCTAEYPGARLEAFITDLLRTIADGEQDDIALEGEKVEYAVYYGTTSDGQALSTVYLVNKSIYGQTHLPRLHACGERIPLRVEGYGIRIAWVADDLLISPFDKFVKVTDIRRTPAGYVIDLAAANPGEYRLQLAHRNGLPGVITLNGQPLTLETDPDGALTVPVRLQAANSLIIEKATASE